MGIALSDEMHRRDMQLLKDMGVNFVRLAHYPQDDAVLRACDELGMLVWEEIPVVDLIALGDEFRANATSALREMIRQHYNHPSVIMWGVYERGCYPAAVSGEETTAQRFLREYLGACPASGGNSEEGRPLPSEYDGLPRNQIYN